MAPVLLKMCYFSPYLAKMTTLFGQHDLDLDFYYVSVN